MTMALAVTKWPIRIIVWGIYSDYMKAFISTRKDRKDEFETQLDAEQHIKDRYSAREQARNMLSVKPKARYGWNQYREEDV